MGSLPIFGAFVIRAQEKDGRTCINGLPVASPSKQMLGRFPFLQALRHQTLGLYLNFYETVKARDLVIIVQEHYSTSLKDLVSRGKLTEHDKKTLFEQISEAMDFLHSKNIVHGFLNVESVYTLEKDDKLTVKLSGYGLPFLTNFGKDSASPMNFGVLQAPEKMLVEDDSFYSTTYLTDTWDLGILLLQIYWGFALEDFISEEEYVEILNKNYDLLAESSKSTIMDRFCQLLNQKSVLPKFVQLPWIESLINDCLQLNCQNRPTIADVARIIRKNLAIRPSDKYSYKVKSVAQMKIQLQKELSNNNDGFEKLSVENIFYLWKTCGSSPEMILLKKGVIQNHAPISSYPSVRYDDFLENDPEEETQSTFELGVFALPNKRTLARMEDGQKICAKPFNKLESFEDEATTSSNILYEQSKNMLTTEHLLNATAIGGLKEVVARLSEMHVVSTQRSEVWCTLLGITAAKYNEFLNLDVLAPHSSDRQLEVDIPRCHQYDSFMTTPAVQESLRKVLKGWQIITEAQNYVYWQGCDSLATPFLLTNMSRPHVAYACFKEFTFRYCHKFYLKDNSEVIKEYLGIFYHLVAYTDPVLYKHLKLNGFDAELFAIPWFLTCFAHELPLSKLVRLWDETLMHGNAFPLMIALAMLNRLRDKLLAVNFNEMIIIIHDQPDLSIEDVIREARAYEMSIPPSCTFRMHASPWNADFVDEVYCLPNSMKGLSLGELSQLHCPRLSSEELIWRLERNMVYAIDTRQEQEFKSEHFIGSFNHPDIQIADIDWLRFLPGIVHSALPKCIIYSKNDKEAAEKLAEAYVMKGVPNICLLHEPYELVLNKESVIVKL